MGDNTCKRYVPHQTMHVANCKAAILIGGEGRSLTAVGGGVFSILRIPYSLMAKNRHAPGTGELRWIFDEVFLLTVYLL